MKKLITLVAGPVAAALLCVAFVSPSCAATTTFVSGKGSDSNPCTLTLPCRTINFALGIAGNGTVSCLDAGPYNENFSTSLSFTLDCQGVVYASASNYAIGLRTTNALFRHVIFDGSAGGGSAVVIGSGNVVFEDCTFQNFTTSPGQAVQFAPTVAGSHLTVTDSVFTNNGGAAGGVGIYIQPSHGITAGAVIERTQLTGNAFGIFADGSSGGTALVDVRYSTITDSVFDGISASTGGQPGSPVASIVVEHSASNHNGGRGINATGPLSYVSLSDSTVDWNATGLNTVNGGTILSYKNNMIAGNLSPGVTPLSFSLQ
jgi:hypothetical protein